MPILSDITLTDILAVWGAFGATLVLLWDIYKWKNSGPQIIFRATPNMKVSEGFGDYSKDKTYVHMEATNNGDRPTTITKAGCFYYKNLMARLLRRSSSQYYIKLSKRPGLLEPGGTWNDLADQQELGQLSKNGILLFALYLSHKRKPQTVRVRIN